MARTAGRSASEAIPQRINARIKAFFHGLKNSLNYAKTGIAALASFFSFLILLQQKAGLPGWMIVLFAAFAGLPILAVVTSEIVPGWLRRIRERRVVSLPESGTSDYFRIGPREDTPGDHKVYRRADNRHVDVLDWLRRADEPILFLTGRSGTGKTSLLAAYVLPKLRAQPAVDSLVIRSYDDPIEALREDLLSRLKRDPRSPTPGPRTKVRTLLELACDQSDRMGRRLLVVFDQFEELAILHGQDPDRVLPMRNLLESIRQRRIKGLTVLLSFRSEYSENFKNLELPALDRNTNWRDVSAFSEPDALSFLHGGFEKIGDGRLKDVLHELRTIEETPGLVRPIVLNMVGVILRRESGPLALASKPGALLSGYVRAQVERSDVRDHAAEILRPMLTEAGTKRPRSVGELAIETRLDPAKVEGYLTQMAAPGLVRRIARPDPIQERTWEVSHDCVARLLEPIVHHPRLGRWQRLRPWLTPAALIVCLAVILGALPYEMERRIVAARDKSIKLLGYEGCSIRIGRAYDNQIIYYVDKFLDDSKVDYDPISRLAPHLSILQSSGSIHLRIRPNENARDVGPLAGLTALRSLELDGTRVADLKPLASLKGLLLLSLNGTRVTDVSPLSHITALQRLELGGTQVADVGPLAHLSALQSINLNRTGVSDLAPLAHLKDLQSLDLDDTKVADLGPLARLVALRSLSLRGTRVSGLAPLSGIIGLQTLSIDRTRVVDLSPVSRLTALQSLSLGSTRVADLAPLSQMSALQALALEDTDVVDLRPLAGLTYLHMIDLNGTAVADLKPLANLVSLDLLLLDSTNVSDLSPLAHLKSLKTLGINRTDVSDLAPLAQLPALQSLFVGGTKLTPEKINNYKITMPHVKFIDEPYIKKPR